MVVVTTSRGVGRQVQATCRKDKKGARNLVNDGNPRSTLARRIIDPHVAASGVAIVIISGAVPIAGPILLHVRRGVPPVVVARATVRASGIRKLIDAARSSKQRTGQQTVEEELFHTRRSKVGCWMLFSCGGFFSVLGCGSSENPGRIESAPKFSRIFERNPAAAV